MLNSERYHRASGSRSCCRSESCHEWRQAVGGSVWFRVLLFRLAHLLVFTFFRDYFGTFNQFLLNRQLSDDAIFRNTSIFSGSFITNFRSYDSCVILSIIRVWCFCFNVFRDIVQLRRVCRFLVLCFMDYFLESGSCVLLTVEGLSIANATYSRRVSIVQRDNARTCDAYILISSSTCHLCFATVNVRHSIDRYRLGDQRTVRGFDLEAILASRIRWFLFYR